jgi:hypothetical protein
MLPAVAYNQICTSVLIQGNSAQCDGHGLTCGANTRVFGVSVWATVEAGAAPEVVAFQDQEAEVV